MFDREWLHAQCIKLDTHQTLEQFFLHLKSFAEKLDFKQMVYTVQPSFYKRDASVPPPIMLTTYDGKWLDYYLERTYTQQDAILEYCIHDDDEPYKFKASTSLHGITTSDLEGLQNKGLTDNGFALPTHKNFGAVSVVTLVDEDAEGVESDKENVRKEYIEYFAYRFNEAILKKFPGQFSPPNTPSLTPKESEVILWLASGLLYVQIAQRLDVGVSTVRKHVASVIKKLNARNSAHACALAVRWGLIY